MPVSKSLLAIDWIELRSEVRSFVMGSELRPEEGPPHRIELSAFELARTQVTRELYQRFLDLTGHGAPPFWNEARFAHPRMPAVGPSWHDALAFCSWATQELGVQVRLPTEAEWECAAKAGREVVYPWGDQPPEELPNYENRWRSGPEPVDGYPSLHPLGFLGLGENVHEWCSDWFAADYYESSPTRDPQGPEHGHRKSSRGGSWRHKVPVSRCAARASIPPELRYNDFGFRLARDT